MNQLYALVIRDCQEFWGYQSDLIGVFDSKERAKRGFIKWFNNNYNVNYSGLKSEACNSVCQK